MTLRNATRTAATAALAAATVLAMPVHAAPNNWSDKATTAAGNCQQEYAMVVGIDGNAVTDIWKGFGCSGAFFIQRVG